MKREIKFRAWNKRDGYMLDDAIYFKSDMSEVALWNGLVYPEYDKQIWKETILMQFTGLLDKNGKEIYEGDILEHLDSTYEGSDDNECFIGVVEYDTTNATFRSSGEDFARERIEVIGNIYENPELI